MCPISLYSVFSRSELHNMFTASTRPVLQHKDPHSSWENAESKEEPEQQLCDWWHKDWQEDTWYKLLLLLLLLLPLLLRCHSPAAKPYRWGNNDVMTPSHHTHTHTHSGSAQCFIYLFRKLRNTSHKVRHREQLTHAVCPSKCVCVSSPSLQFWKKKIMIHDIICKRAFFYFHNEHIQYFIWNIKSAICLHTTVTYSTKVTA